MNLALRSALSHFENNDGELVIGGREITSIAREYGTPLYIYDRSFIERRAKNLRAALPDHINISYAVKANPNVDILRLLASLYDGFDISSQGEMEKAISVDIQPCDLSFSGPGKTVDELKFAIKNRIGTISIESEREVDHIRALCKDLDTTCSVLIRVNPGFDLFQYGMKMSSGPSKFGIDENLVPSIIENIQKDDRIQFQGIHIHNGSQNLNAEELVKAFGKILEYSKSLSSSIKIPIKTINMGGGLGIPYFSHETDLDLVVLSRGLSQLLNTYKIISENTILRMELGRFLVGESGLYLCRVLYRKISNEKVFIITDGGLHQHLAASGNFGQSLIRRPMPMTVANKLNNPVERAHVVGVLCTPLDSFGYVEMPKAEEGDLIAILNSGAYGFSASPKDFISHKPPKEIIIS